MGEWVNGAGGTSSQLSRGARYSPSLSRAFRRRAGEKGKQGAGSGEQSGQAEGSARGSAEGSAGQVPHRMHAGCRQSRVGRSQAHAIALIDSACPRETVGRISSSWIPVRDGCEGGGHPIRSNVKILLPLSTCPRRSTTLFAKSQNAKRIEEIAQSEDHEEEAVLYHIPADS
jgi:hypothetical protein